MDVNATAIKAELNKYFEKKSTKKELTEWASNLHGELLLTGEILKIEKLAVYKFLTKLSMANCFCEPCTDAEILEISDILNGQTDMAFIFSIKMPEKYLKTNISKIHKILLEYYEKRALPSSKLVELETFYNNKSICIAKTVEELLEVQIASLLLAAYAVYYDESDNPIELIFRLNNTVFMHTTDIKEVAEDAYLSKIFRYLDCCMGKEFFCVRVEFDKGLYNVSLLV